LRIGRRRRYGAFCCSSESAVNRSVKERAAGPPISAQNASIRAEDFLVNEVGDLLMVEKPRLVESLRSQWVFTVTVGNAVQGLLGPMGTIAVDAGTGEVLFDEGERARIRANAERLSRSATP
jgi:hypothetical protein